MQALTLASLSTPQTKGLFATDTPPGLVTIQISPGSENPSYAPRAYDTSPRDDQLQSHSGTRERGGKQVSGSASGNNDSFVVIGEAGFELSDYSGIQRRKDAKDRQLRREQRKSEKRQWLEDQDEMKFSHSIQFNAVPDWASHYIAYSNLKKLYVTHSQQCMHPWR